MRQIVLEVKYGERRKGIGFPCTEQDLQEAMKDLDVRENYGAKLFVPKILHPAFLQDLEDGFINLDEINYLAKRMDSFIQEEMDEFAAVVTQKKMTEPKDLINLTFNLNAYTLIQDVSNMSAIGRKQLLSMRGAVSCEEMDKTDLAAIGRELVNSCKGTFTEYCCRMTEAKHLRPSSACFLSWGTMSRGKRLTARISVFPNPAKDARIAELYSLWYDKKEETIRIYTDAVPKRVPLSSNDEFKAISNAVIKEAVNIMLGQEQDDPQEELYEEEPTEKEWECSARHKQCNKKTMWEFYFWGKKYLDKDSEEYNPHRAVELFTESAHRGNTVAKYRLGKMFLRGDEIKQDVAFAVRWLDEAIEDGNQYAQYLLGKELLKGEISERDIEKAEELLRRSAEKGNKYAAYTLGKELQSGDSFAKDMTEAAVFLRSSADKGFVPAQYVLGRLLYKGEEVVRDISQALRYLERAAEKNDKAAYLVGKIYLTEKDVRDVPKALRYLEQAAKEGNSVAEYLLGKTYLFGEYTQRDYEKAVDFLQSAALHGNAFAERLLIEADEHNKAFEELRITNGVLRLFRSIARMLKEKTEEKGKGGIALTDKKLRRKIEEKKQAQGLRHE